MGKNPFKLQNNSFSNKPTPNRWVHGIHGHIGSQRAKPGVGHTSVRKIQ